MPDLECSGMINWEGIRTGVGVAFVQRGAANETISFATG